MANKAIDVAKYIIKYEHSKGRSITNLRLQKLLYFCQGSVIMNTPDHSLCFDDYMEAWDYGPVVPSVYREYCEHYFFDLPDSDFEGQIDNDNIINFTLDKAASLTTGELVGTSHNQAPWQEAYIKGCKKTISQDRIIEFFKNKSSRE